MGRLENKVAIITGGAGGMGETHAKRFIEEGAKVVIADLENSAGEKLAGELGDNALFVPTDVASENSWKNLVDTTIAHFSQIDILVSNAGILKPALVEDTSLEDFKKILDINLVGVFLGMKYVVPHMKERQTGSIINVSSIAGLVGTAEGGVAYGASKFGIRGLTKTVALEVAEYGVRVNSVHPGVIRTPMTEGGVTDESFANIPAKRLAEPEEVTNLVLYLASDEASYSNGSEFVVDGGYTAK